MWFLPLHPHSCLFQGSFMWPSITLSHLVPEKNTNTFCFYKKRLWLDKKILSLFKEGKLLIKLGGPVDFCFYQFLILNMRSLLTKNTIFILVRQDSNSLVADAWIIIIFHFQGIGAPRAVPKRLFACWWLQQFAKQVLLSQMSQALAREVACWYQRLK